MLKIKRYFTLLIIILILLCASCKKEEKYNLTFNSNGGELVSSFEGLIYETEPIISRTGYVFAGWYSNKSLVGNRVDFPLKLTKDLILYASWQPLEYKVSYEANNGTETINITQGYNSLVNEPKEIKKEYNYFAGWYDNADFLGDPISFPFVLVNDITLYAKWINYSYLFFQHDSQTNTFTVVACLPNVKEVFIPAIHEGKKVISIGEGAFNLCSELEKITIPEGITEIGDYAFNLCEKLTNIDLPNSLRKIGKQAFGLCSSLKSIIIPNSVIYLGEGAFYECAQIEKIILSDNIPTILDSTFYNCIQLTEVKLSLELKSIDSLAFYGCEVLREIDIPDKVISIAGEAFMGCLELRKITIGAELSSIGKNAFYQLLKLEEIIISEENATYKVIDNVLFTKDLTLLVLYPAAKENDNYKIPEGVTSIMSYAFAYSQYLLNIIITQGVLEIGEGAFCFSNLLTNVVVLNGLLFIGDSAFYECKNLESINFSESVIEIGTGAFAFCTSLQTVIIPLNVERIKSYAFYGCSNLTIFVTADSDLPEWDNDWYNEATVIYNYLD